MYNEPIHEPTEEYPANAYFSQGKDGYHYQCIDIDIPIRVVPSSTPGHSHLYVDEPITWDTYKNLLEALAEAGIVEEGYLNASVDTGVALLSTVETFKLHLNPTERRRV